MPEQKTKLSCEKQEQMADSAHQIWAHWMRYMFSQGEYHEDGSWTMPKDKVERWTR